MKINYKVNHKNCKKGYGLIKAADLCNICPTIPFEHILNSTIEYWLTNHCEDRYNSSEDERDIDDNHTLRACLYLDCIVKCHLSFDDDTCD